VNESNWIVPEKGNATIESDCEFFINNLHNNEQSIEYNCIS